MNIQIKKNYIRYITLNIDIDISDKNYSKTYTIYKHVEIWYYLVKWTSVIFLVLSIVMKICYQGW